MLASHPDVFMARKELHYFGKDLEYHRVPMSLARYHQHFDSRPANALRAGDASAWTLFSETAPAEIQRYAPDAQIVVTLRCPAEMIHSIHGLLHYTCQEDIGNFDRAVGCEPERVAGRDIPEPSRPRMALHYTALGRYHSHLTRWIEVFGRERVHVVLLDEVKSDAAAVGAGLSAFLGLEGPIKPASHSPRGRNANRAYRSGRIQRWTQRQPNRAMVDGVASFTPLRRVALGLINRFNGRFSERRPMHRRTRKHIDDTLRAEVEALGSLLDRDLGHWLI